MIHTTPPLISSATCLQHPLRTSQIYDEANNHRTKKSENKKQSFISGTSLCAGFFSAVTLIALSLLQTANADTSIPIVNGSFEDSTGYTGGNPTNIPGWTQGEAYGQVEDVSAFFTSGLTGVKAIYIGGYIQQATSFTFVPGATYTISYDLGRPFGSTGSYGVTFGFRNAANDGFLGSEGAGFQTSNASAAVGTFQSFSSSYTALESDAGNVVRLGITDYFGGGNSQYIDNITASTTVPEPATYAGGILCSLCLYAGLRRRISGLRQVPV